MFGDIALTIGLTAAAIILHEVAHGAVAYAFGDPTAKIMGRLTLNPFKHVDRVGTVLLPGFLAISQLLSIGHIAFMFGWAKPVPVDPRHFRYPRQMMAMVAIAGPATNIVLAVLAALVLRQADLSESTVDAANLFLMLNLVLAFFNLVPIPPLDGGRIMVGILPAFLARPYAQLERFGMGLVMALIILPPLLRMQGIQVDPLGHTLLPAVEWARRWLLAAVGADFVEV